MRVLFIGAPVSAQYHPDWTLEDRFAAYGRNTGNLLIGQSLREELKISRCEFHRDAPPAGADDEFDVIVVAAANFIFRGFDLSRYANFIEATNLPCVVAGLGAQAPNREATFGDIPEGSKRFLKVIAERSKVIGVRGNFTAEVMNDFGITNVRPIGCPSMFRSRKRGLRIRRPEAGTTLRISLNGSRDTVVHMRSPDDARRVEASLIRLSIAEGHSYVLQSETPEIEILTARATTSQQRQVIKLVCDDLGATDLAHILDRHVLSNGRLFFDLDEWDSHIRSVDLSIGSRFHGNLIALTNGTPAILLNHDSRTTEMAELMGIPHVFTEDVKAIDPRRLLEQADFDGFEKRYRTLYDRFADFLTENRLPHHLHDAIAVEEPDRVLEPVGRIVPDEPKSWRSCVRAALEKLALRSGKHP